MPEDRPAAGAVPEMSLAENALLTAHRQRARAKGFIRAAAVRASPTTRSTAFDVKAGGAAAAARSLSGGNLQKFIVGREILPGAAGA